MSPGPLQCGLNDTHCQQLNAVLASVAHGRQYCAKCSAAGVDMSAALKVLKEQEALALGLKKEFFPNMA